MQRPGPFYNSHNPFSERPQPPRWGEQPAAAPLVSQVSVKDEAAERSRRTSISGLLQRPESEPQRPLYNQNPPGTGSIFDRPNSATITPQNGHELNASNMAERQPQLTGSYDTRPPPFSNSFRSTYPNLSNEPAKQLLQERLEVKSLSPEVRRQQPNGIEHRSLAGILNQPSEQTLPHNMTRQDSVQSQSDRSTFGDRWRPRAFSPFANSVTSQAMSAMSASAEEPGRKGSDELSQHRTLLNLAAESKRGRYSPVPQAVQGAQAQTPVPDAGVQNEHGRVFAGLGGLGAPSSGPTSTHGPLAASPFKSNEGSARLSEENLMKISRSSSGINKRPRKYDDEMRAESEAGIDKKAVRVNKRSKYAHSYKLDLEESQQRNAPLPGLNGIVRTASPINGNGGSQKQHHHHQLQQRVSATEQPPLFKPKKTVRISSVIAAVKRAPRRHIGSFRYDPQIESPHSTIGIGSKFDVSIRPSLLPSFSGKDQVNCTYSVRIPKLWLQTRERRLICKEAYLWGTGVYTDDSDIVAAAMHSGFIRSVPPENVDDTLLQRVIKEQNTKIEGLIDPPEGPIEPPEGQDAIITALVLPNLERYTESCRFGIHSRSWPDSATKTQHDGVSFAIMKVDYASGGVESRRMGRTGKEKRARLKLELEARKQNEAYQRQMIEKMRKKMLERKKNKSKLAINSATKVKAPISTLGKVVGSVKTTAPALDVGQTPGDWLKQVDVSAV